MGIKKSGKAKRGTKTWYPPRQKAIEFIHKPAYPTAQPASAFTDVESGVTASFQGSPHLVTKLDAATLPQMSFIDEEDPENCGDDATTTAVTTRKVTCISDFPNNQT